MKGISWFSSFAFNFSCFVTMHSSQNLCNDDQILFIYPFSKIVEKHYSHSQPSRYNYLAELQCLQPQPTRLSQKIKESTSIQLCSQSTKQCCRFLIETTILWGASGAAYLKTMSFFSFMHSSSNARFSPSFSHWIF